MSAGELSMVIPDMRAIDCYKRPDYAKIYTGLVAVLKRTGVKWSDKYDWESDADAKAKVSEEV